MQKLIRFSAAMLLMMGILFAMGSTASADGSNDAPPEEEDCFSMPAEGYPSCDEDDGGEGEGGETTPLEANLSEVSLSCSALSYVVTASGPVMVSVSIAVVGGNSLVNQSFPSGVLPHQGSVQFTLTDDFFGSIRTDLLVMDPASTEVLADFSTSTSCGSEPQPQIPEVNITSLSFDCATSTATVGGVTDAPFADGALRASIFQGESVVVFAPVPGQSTTIDASLMFDFVPEGVFQLQVNSTGGVSFVEGSMRAIDVNCSEESGEEQGEGDNEGEGNPPVVKPVPPAEQPADSQQGVAQLPDTGAGMAMSGKEGQTVLLASLALLALMLGFSVQRGVFTSLRRRS